MMCQNTVLTAIILLSGCYAAILIDMVLKIPHDCGQHANHCFHSGFYVSIEGRCRCNRGCYTVSIRRFKDIPHKGPHLRIRHRPHNVACLDINIPVLVAYNQTQIRFLLKIQADLVRIKINRIRLHNLNRCCTHNIFALQQFYIDCSGAVFIRYKTACFVNCTHTGRFFCQLPFQTIRQFRRAAAAIYTDSCELYRRSRGIQLILRRNCGMIKYAILRICGNAQHAGADGPLLPVRGFTEHLQFSTLFTGCKSRRAAAIQIQGCYTAGILQNRCHLIIIHTNGPRRQASFRHEKHDAAVRPDAYAIAGIHCPIAGLLDHAIFQKVKWSGNCFHDIICSGTCIPDHRSAIRQNCKIRFIGGFDHISFHNQIACRFTGTHIEIVAIGCHDYGAFRICDGSIIRCQLRSLFHAPLTISDHLGVAYTVCLCAALCIVSVISNLQLHIFCEINLRHITNRLMVVLISHDNFVICHSIGDRMVCLRHRRQSR